jgi:hypothetical protein
MSLSQNHTETEILSANMYYFAFTFLANNYIFSRTLLNPTDSAHLVLNQFNYSTNVSPTIITPNYDVLYAPCPIDLTPLIGTNDYYELTLPNEIDLNKRYYVCQFIDLFTNNFYYVSPKTNLRFNKSYKIYAPDYKGRLDGTSVKAQSWYMLILLRVEINFRKPGDLELGIQFEKNIKLNTFNYVSAGVKLPNTLNLDIKSKKVNVEEFYNYFLDIAQYQVWYDLKEKFFIEEFRKLGVFITEYPFNSGCVIPYSSPNPLINVDNIRGIVIGNTLINLILRFYKNKSQNYWTTTANSEKNEFIPQSFEFVRKALTAWQYIYANNRNEAIYWQNTYDESGIQLTGNDNYIIDFTMLPPISQPGFWSITAYTPDGYVYENPNQQYFTVGHGIDFPCQVILSNSPPTDLNSNLWLQTPPTNYYIILRLYHTNIQSYNYVPPSIKRL